MKIYHQDAMNDATLLQQAYQEWYSRKINSDKFHSKLRNFWIRHGEDVRLLLAEAVELEKENE